MPRYEGDLPAALEAEMSAVVPYLLEKGWEIFEFRYEPQAVGDWYIDFFRSDLTIHLVRDGSQYFVDDPAGNLEPASLQRVFTDPAEFQKAVIEWIKHLETNAKDT